MLRLGSISALALAGHAFAQTACTNTVTPTNGIQPSIAPGWEYGTVATGLTEARSIEFDSEGHLLIIQAGIGLTSHTLDDDGGVCVGFAEDRVVIANENLTHSLAFSDPHTLFVSTSDVVLQYSYDPVQQTVNPDPITIVRNMSTGTYISRTLLIPQLTPDTIVVSRGSNQNIDPLAEDITSGVSTVKSFPLTDVPEGGWEHSSEGTLLGWGLRNEVGIAEHPATGGIWGVENSVNNLVRDGVNVQLHNPGEELNYFGPPPTPGNGGNGGGDYPTYPTYPSDPSPPAAPERGSNYGYPNCWATWEVDELPNNAELEVGVQFAQNSSMDAMCASDRTPPRLTFPAHVAPLDVKFNAGATEAWISYHGSFSRQFPRVGYSVVRVQFDPATGQPVDAADSMTAAETIFANQDLGRCPDNCHRPVGILFDHENERVFISSDDSGEIYVVRRVDS